MNDRITTAFPIRSYPYRVYYADTDAGGVVYYAQYLRMFEQTRTLYLEDCGISLTELADQNCLFVCRRAEVDYISSAKLGDQLDIETRISGLGKTHVTFSYTITCPMRNNQDGDPTLIAKGITKLVSIREKEGNARPIRIPKTVLNALSANKSPLPAGEG